MAHPVLMAGQRLRNTRCGAVQQAGCHLRGLRLENCELRRADLSDTDLSDAVMRLVELDGANLQGAQLAGARIEECSAEAVDFSRARLTSAHMHQSEFARAVFDHADLSGALADGAGFRGASLRGAMLLGAHLHDADFRGADLEGADFADADLTGADFRGALLANACFDRACVDGCRFDVAVPITNRTDADASPSADDGQEQRARALLQRLFVGVPSIEGMHVDRFVPALDAFAREDGDAAAAMQEFARRLGAGGLMPSATLQPLVGMLHALESAPDNDEAFAQWQPLLEHLFPELVDGSVSYEALAQRLATGKSTAR
ncbi:pentapeptide repeat-containing protein [Montanilutibacter psychrotolerans]|uniref:Pentapeptide repeat-containing protein n=1 Tax=Montanilutibacter psychrotolerans TaxID=1327343 RepID=A0A3M8SZL1_9GAMM|nr:pentapeptide repeat-containing protein [Lysobacter psychrotolerans]RNF86203.1 pentapeptide repeat-containing protein [Lysobacter psychrotolerans]